MLFKVYTQYLNEPALYHGTIEADNEFKATLYAYECAKNIFSQHEYDEAISSFEDYHDALFSTVNFWVED